MFQENVDALIAAWNEGNLDGLDAYFTADTVRKAPAALSSNAHSLAELKQVITAFRTAYPDAKVTIHEVYYQEDRSFALWTFEGTNTGPGNHPATGKSVKISGSSFGRYEGGKMKEELVHFDALEMMGQLGLLEMP